MLPRGQRLPHRPQLLMSNVVSVQVPAGLAPQQVEFGNVQEEPDPQRQVLFVQVFDDPVQSALPQQTPLTQVPEQQMPSAIVSVEHRVRSCTGG